MPTRTQSSEGLRHLINPVLLWVIKSGKIGTHSRQAQRGQAIWNADESVINPRLHSKEEMYIELEQRWYFFYRVF